MEGEDDEYPYAAGGFRDLYRDLAVNKLPDSENPPLILPA
jgi:hypothetical protein